MLFQDSNALQQQLFNDLDLLIKIIKIEQEGYVEVNDVLANIFQNKQEIETNILIDNDIANYRRIVKNIQQNAEKHSQEKRNIVEKFQNVQDVQQSVIILLKRVVSRVLEVVFNSLNQLSLKPINSYKQYSQFKLVCQKMLSETNTKKPLKILKCMSDFITYKLSKSLMTLSIVTNNLENGKIQEIDKLKLSSYLNKIHQKDIILKQDRSARLESNKIIKCKIIPIIKENDPILKQQIKTKEKGRFLIQRKGKKVLDIIKDVVQINRHAFLQDIIDYQNNKQTLLKNMLARNKCNQKQITQFLTKKTHLRRKIQMQKTQREIKNTNKQQAKIGTKKADEFSQTICPTTRRSLLFKFKENEYRERTITSQFYRKITKADEYRQKFRSQISSNIEFKKAEKEKIGNYKTIQEIASQNQQLNLNGITETNGDKQKLPLLNKRALSVDKNYKLDQVEAVESQSNFLSISNKFGDRLNKKSKGEKTEVLPCKIKIELKTVSNSICNSINKKLSKFENFNKQLCF